LAALPREDRKLEAPNWCLTMTPKGLGNPVTKEIIKKRANIIAIGNA
jgi:hypothetical protein